MEEILKQINSDILTESVVSELKSAFDAQVSLRVEEFTKSTLLSENEKMLDLYDTKLEEFKTTLNESKEKELEEYKNEIVESLDSYLDVVVGEFLKENKIAIDEEVSAIKSKTILEAFDAILVTAGIDVARIVEGKDKEEVEVSESAAKKLSDMEDRYNNLLEEKKILETKNTEMLVLGLKNELSEGLSVVQKDRFNKLADLVDIIDDKKVYLTKLEAIKESIMSTNTVTETIVDDKSKKVEVITESKKPEQQIKVDSSRFF